MSSFVFPLITFPYVTRILLPAGTGRVAFAISLISYFNVFAQLGVPTYGVRACAQVRDNKEELTKTAQELSIYKLGRRTYIHSTTLYRQNTIHNCQCNNIPQCNRYGVAIQGA